MSGFWSSLFKKESGPSPEELKKANRDARKQHTILVIDDDQAFLHIIRPVLQEEGYNVLTSSSGTKGLNMLRYAPTDIRVVLLDYSMPTFDGAETLKFVRKLSPNAKVVAVTGMDLNLLPAGFREGVDAFVQKPFQMKNLLSIVDKIVTGQPLDDTPPEPPPQPE